MSMKEELLREFKGWLIGVANKDNFFEHSRTTMPYNRCILNKIGGLFVGTAISTCAFLLLAYEWDSKFLVALAFIIAITGACTNFNIKFK